jgi:hypothetical protein
LELIPEKILKYTTFDPNITILDVP